MQRTDPPRPDAVFEEGRQARYTHILDHKAWEMRDVTMPGDHPPIPPRSPYAVPSWDGGEWQTSHPAVIAADAAWRQGAIAGEREAHSAITQAGKP